MKRARKFAGHVLTGAICLFALQAQAGETPSAPARPSAAEHCLKSLGMQDMQPFKDLAKNMSPEILLDRVFSSVAPDFQKALLSKPEDPAKPVKGPEGMRDPKLFLPAIATMPMSGQWINVTADGRLIEPANSGAADDNWTRLDTEAPGAQTKASPSVPWVLPVPRRY